MAYQKRREMDDNTAVLFMNDDARGERDPVMKGSAKIDGVDYWANLWKNESKAGKPYVKISLRPKEERKRRYEDSQAPSEYDDTPRDKIPF